MAAFQTFGPDHLGALGAVALAAWLAARLARRRPGSAFPRWLAVLLLAAVSAELLIVVLEESFTLQRALPLQLCDLALFATAFALWTRGQAAFEFAWFWGLSGTIGALLTPDVARGFPDPNFVRFFVAHGGIVAGVFFLGPPGLGLRTRRGAVRRVYLATAAYAAVLGVVDWLLDANYMYLCEKPPGPLLAPFGPWPWYLFGGAAIAALSFWLLDLVARRPARA
ncbi:MAG: YwaF family protein [Planctomycetota bacterium]|jgi:hypothetical integral membrane protein (TIGR02206 family)